MKGFETPIPDKRFHLEAKWEKQGHKTKLIQFKEASVLPIFLVLENIFVNRDNDSIRLLFPLCSAWQS